MTASAPIIAARILDQLKADAASQDETAAALAALRYQDAIVAVLDLHPPWASGRHCSRDGQPYPCPTVRVIADALGVSS